METAISSVLASRWRRQHPVFSPSGMWTSTTEFHTENSDRRSGDYRSDLRVAGIDGPLSRLLSLWTAQSLEMDSYNGLDVNIHTKDTALQPLSIDEIKAAVWGLNNEGAPGPDGIPIFFYKNCWDTIAPELMQLMDDLYAGQC